MHIARIQRYGKNGCLLLILGNLISAPSGVCEGGIIRDDRSDSLYQDYADQSRFDATVAINCPTGFCSGTLIAPDWVLTAAHCVLTREKPLLPNGNANPNSGALQDGRSGTYTVYNDDLTSVSSSPATPSSPSAIAHPLWVANMNVSATTDTTAVGKSLSAGFDFVLIHLSRPVDIVPAFRNSVPLNSSFFGTTVTLVGYGTSGTGLTGGVIPAGTRRAGDNAFDAFDGDGGTVTGITYPAQNHLLMDFDQPGSSIGTLGSDMPRDLEYHGASGDSGGPWYMGSDTVVGVMSFGRDHIPNPANSPLRFDGYGDYSGAGRVDLANDWINSVMGGANWNARTTVGSIPFNTFSAWGDRRVPASGADVRFSLPDVSPFLYGTPNISFSQDTNVGNMTVEFGLHAFSMGTRTLTATGRVAVDKGGTLSITNGTLSALNQLGIAETPDKAGKIKLGTGGTLIVSDDTTNGLFVGQNGYGVIEQTGGSLDVKKDAFFGNIGTPKRSLGTYDLSGGDAIFGRHLYVGNYGDGIVNQSGSSVATVELDLYIGLNSGEGQYDLYGGTLNVHRFLFAGYRGTGTFNQTSGTTTAVAEISVGRIKDSDGTLLLSGGSLNSLDDIVVGYAGQGTMEITGGVASANTSVYLGYESTGNGTIRVSESTATLKSDQSLVVGRAGNGLFEQSAGTVKVGGNLTIASAANSTGIYNLSGGILDVSQGWIQFGAGTQREFNFTGGTLHVGTYGQGLSNQGGVLSPGAPDNSIGSTAILGDYTQAENGALAIDVANLFGQLLLDTIHVGGTATLDGMLLPSVFDGFLPASSDTFEILNAASITGSFANELPGGRIPTLGVQGSFSITYSPTQVILSDFLAGPVGMPGDFDLDGDVDGRDFLAWQRNPNVGNLADWQANYGTQALSATTAVPEPTLLAMCCGIFVSVCRRRSLAIWPSSRDTDSNLTQRIL